MELSILDLGMRPIEVVDEFQSIIWTERFSKVGDLTVVMEATAANMGKIPVGTKLGLSDTPEVAIIDTVEIDGDSLKATGKMLTQILDGRFFRAAPAAATTPPSADNREYSFPTAIPSWAAIQRLVEGVLLPGGQFIAYIPDGAKQVFANMSVWAPQILPPNDPDAVWSVPYGSLLNAIDQIAQTSQQVGYRLQVDDLTGMGGQPYSLGFYIYPGNDRTPAGVIAEGFNNEPISLSQDLDTLSDLKQLRSNAGYKTAAYVYGSDDGTHPTPGVAYTDANASMLFDRRVIVEYAEDITMAVAGNNVTTFQNLLKQRAKNVLANNNFIKYVDGQVINQPHYTFGVDYFLGDIIELDSGDGLVTRARVTESIRTQDHTGEQLYPTVSILD